MSPLLSDIFKLLIVAVVILLHGYFVATEYALVTLRKTRVQQLADAGSRTARLVLRTLDDLQELIAAVQLGVTMASLALGALAEPTIATVIEPWFVFVPHAWRPVSAHGIALVFTFAFITALDIVVAELVPKTIALQNSERVAFVVIRPVRAFIWLFRPFIAVLNRAGGAIVRLTGLRPLGEGDAAHSPEELKMLVAASTRAGVLNTDEQEMLFRVFEFSRLTARQVMVPRTEILALDIEMTREQVYEILGNTHHTRYPVYRGTIDDIAGILYVRDLLNRFTSHDQIGFDLRQLVREPYFVPDSVPIEDLLAQLRREQVQIAVVLDEFGGTAGLVTLEDVLERIVGEVRDEFEKSSPEIQMLAEGDAVIDGLTLVGDVNERFALALDEEDYDTLGGLLWGELGRLPQVGDTLEIEGGRLAVEAMDGRRVAAVRLSRSGSGGDAVESAN